MYSFGSHWQTKQAFQWQLKTLPFEIFTLSKTVKKYVLLKLLRDYLFINYKFKLFCLQILPLLLLLLSSSSPLCRVFTLIFLGQTMSLIIIIIIIIFIISVVTLIEIWSNYISQYFSYENRRQYLSSPGTERTQTLTDVMQNAKQGMLSPDLYSAA